MENFSFHSEQQKHSLSFLGSLSGGVAEWLRCSVSNHARSTRVGSNPRRGNH